MDALTAKPEPETEPAARPDHDADLVDLPGNPVPEGAQTAWLMTPDGIRLRTARWAGPGRPARGTVIVLGGRTEVIEEYFETINDLRERGFGVLTFDWRGQGGSERLLRGEPKGHVEHFDQYLTDLGTVLQDVALPDCKPPYYILGHSLGSLVALRAAPALGNRIRRMVLCAPLLELNNLPLSQPMMQRIFGFMSLIGLGQTPVGSYKAPGTHAFNGNRLTSDEERFERNISIFKARPELETGPPTAAFTFAICRAMQEVRRSGYAAAISVPTLMVLAGRDEVVRTEIAEAYADAMRTGGFITIAGSRHELLQESDLYREQVLAAFDAFVPGSE